MCSARMFAEIASASDCVATVANCGAVGEKCLVRGAVGSVELQAASTATARAVGTTVRRCIGNSWLQPRRHGARPVPPWSSRAKRGSALAALGDILTAHVLHGRR